MLFFKYGSVYFVSGSRRYHNPKGQRATFFRKFFRIYRTSTRFFESGWSLTFGVMVIGMCLCWMWKKPIGRDDTKVSRVWVLYRDWLYRRKISKKFWRAKMGGGCWRYRRPIERDESREWLVWLWYRFWQYKRKFGSGILVKSWSKSQKMLESGREKSPEGRNARKSV